MESVPMMALTRTCDLADFPDGHTVADWQQALAQEAYGRLPDPVAGTILCINWGGCAFTAPGADPVYRLKHTGGGPRATDTLAAVFALSVLDRLNTEGGRGGPLGFLHTHALRVLPGGLFFCTFAYWDAEGPDCATGHERRRRIYDRHSWLKLVSEVKAYGLRPLGEVDWTYHGHTLGDHTLASLVLTKGDRP
jgi:hypothetical protein